MKFGNLNDEDYDEVQFWEDFPKQSTQNQQNNLNQNNKMKIQRIQSPFLQQQILLNPNEDLNYKKQNDFQLMLQAQHKKLPTQNNWMQQQQQNNNIKDFSRDYFVPDPPPRIRIVPQKQQAQQNILPDPKLFQEQKLPCHPFSLQKIHNIFEHPLQKKSQTMEICSACNQPKEQNHQCNGEYGFILCPFCGDSVVRNFMKEHQEECIPYLESLFTKLDNKGEECQICYVDMTNNYQTLKCNHTFHKKCIDEWKVKSKECPICRGKI